MQHRTLLTIWSLLLFMYVTTSCSYLTDSSSAFISTSGSGELTINSDAPIPLERIAILIDNLTLELHILGSLCTISAEGGLLGEGTSLIATLPYDPLFTSLCSVYYTLEALPSFSYTTQVEATTSPGGYIDMVEGTLIIRESQGVYSIQALCSDSLGNNIIASFMGYLLRTVDLR